LAPPISKRRLSTVSVFDAVISERRAEDRHLFRTEVLILVPGGGQYIGQTLDIGTGGMAIVCDINPPQGFELTIRLTTPARSRGSLTFEARATVANCVLAGRDGGFRIGLAFVSLDAAANAALAGILG
jgi:hypothetical protein